MSFCIFDKLKNEIQKFMIIFCFYLDMKNEIQIINNYSCLKKDFYIEFLKLSFVSIFIKNGKGNTVRFLFFIFMMELKNKLLKQIRINFMITVTSMIYMLFKSKFVSSPLTFSAVQWSCGHQESAA